MIDLFIIIKIYFLIYDIESDNIDKLKKYIDIKDIKDFPHKHKSR